MNNTRNTKKIIIFLTLAVLLIGATFYFTAPGAESEEQKEYRQGQIIFIGGENYLIASNKSFVEILKITSDDKLVQVSEVRGMDQVRDLYAYYYENNAYLIVASTRYMWKYDISNPLFPKVLLQRDLYEWHNWGLTEGRGTVGSIYFLTGNNDYIFALGANGVRGFGKDNLLHFRIYTKEKSYGIAVDNDNILVLMDGKAQLFDIETGEMVREYLNMENVQPETRRPYIDYLGNVYSLVDNGLAKISGFSEKRYYSPTEPGIKFSYAVKALPNGKTYYANGYGLAGFDKDLKKLGFLFSANGYKYGTGSWAVSLDAAEVKQGSRVALFNKSSILWLDENMNVLYQYKYTPAYSASAQISTELKITASRYSGSPNTPVTLSLYGFWPNETVKVDFGSNSYNVNVDNFGYGQAEMTVPTSLPDGSTGGIMVINAKGQSSGMGYQTTFRME